MFKVERLGVFLTEGKVVSVDVAHLAADSQTPHANSRILLSTDFNIVTICEAS